MKRCEVCDRPKAAPELWEHPAGCACDECSAVCWSHDADGCTGTPVDWRARALSAEASLRATRIRQGQWGQ